VFIAQISDPHIRPKDRLYQNTVDSNADFAAAIRHLNGLDPRPDIVILTGDIVDEGTEDEYAMALELLVGLHLPLFVIPGNHDEPRAFKLAFDNHVYLPAQGPFNYVIDDRGPVRIIALDVTKPGHHHGDVDDVSVAWLKNALGKEPDRPSIIMMHQPPFACGVPYLDLYLCRGGDRLAAVAKAFAAIERIVCGHVHRFMQLRFAGTSLCTAPSTTTTIDLRLRFDAKPASFHEPRACLLHHWKEDTGLITHLSMIGQYPGPFPFA
jgi:3',5'-cyclic AMP phosphodiesterase CpdA